MYEEDRKKSYNWLCERKNLIDIQKMFQFKIHKDTEDDVDSHRGSKSEVLRWISNFLDKKFHLQGCDMSHFILLIQI